MPKCTVFPDPDGSAIAEVHIPIDVMRRLKTRAGTQDLGEYLWENIFRSAISSHVY